ncbi:MAG: MerR family transcriptional regulator [Burkholderiales bacterium]|nr:MerR family transcriptional regulator [Anaerolineae bacterium]
MASKIRYLKTSDIAKELRVHVNTVRLYEEWGYLPPIPRAKNGYRQYSPMHMEYARLAIMAIRWPYLSDKPQLEEMVKSAANGDLGMAMERAYQHLAFVRTERTYAESAIEFLERWAAGHLMDRPRQRVNISEAARHLNVTVDMLRNWERNGLIDVPRDPVNLYRLYGTAEFGRLRVIRTLVQSGYSLMAILRMMLHFDAGKTENLREALTVPESEDEPIQIIADRWLVGLIEQEERAQAIIRQISHIIEMAHALHQPRK